MSEKVFAHVMSKADPSISCAPDGFLCNKEPMPPNFVHYVFKTKSAIDL